MTTDALTECHRKLQQASRLVDEARHLAFEPALHACELSDRGVRALNTYQAILDAAAAVRFLRLQVEKESKAAL